MVYPFVMDYSTVKLPVSVLVKLRARRDAMQEAFSVTPFSAEKQMPPLSAGMVIEMLLDCGTIDPERLAEWVPTARPRGRPKLDPLERLHRQAVQKLAAKQKRENDRGTR